MVKSLLIQRLNLLRGRSGLLSSSICMVFLGAYTISEGPWIKSEYLRYALAGTLSTVLVEGITHAIDTVNMQSKVVSS